MKKSPLYFDFNAVMWNMVAPSRGSLREELRKLRGDFSRPRLDATKTLWDIQEGVIRMEVASLDEDSAELALPRVAKVDAITVNDGLFATVC